MNDNQKHELKSKEILEKYLSLKGVKKKGSNYSCMLHNDREPSTSIKVNEKGEAYLHCFTCDYHHDIFSLVGEIEGIKDFTEQYKRVCEVAGVSMETTFKQEDHEVIKAEPKQINYKDHLVKWNKNCTAGSKGHEYLLTRGITEEVIQKFNVGYVEDEVISYIKDGEERKLHIKEAIVIPTSDYDFTIRAIGENIDKKDRYRKIGKATLLNSPAFNSDEVIVLVEGAIDCMSIYAMNLGVVEAVALNGLTHTPLEVALKKNKPKKPIIIAMDNDEAGKAGAQKLSKLLDRLSIPYIIDYEKMNGSLYGEHKDGNEALIKDMPTFMKRLMDIKGHAIELSMKLEEEAKAKEEAEREEYKQLSASYTAYNFMKEVFDNKTPNFIPTKFPKLDRVLEGGLYEGLYFIGAISSLGKTTLVTQIADQIAGSGQDVLLFSLEMASSEIASKSISRITFNEVINKRAKREHAKTTRGITTASRYEYYCKEEKELIRHSLEVYTKQIGNHIIIQEGVGDIGVKQVAEKVATHKRITGNSPVVIIDYIQILSPNDVRASDKQNTDKAVLELKRLSRDYKIPIIGISSLNRTNYSTEINMSAFKESGAIEYSADVLIGLQLKGVGKEGFNVDEAKQKAPREVELKILKNRNGSTGGTIEYQYYPMFNTFLEIE